jgi:hypothetical protein
MTVGTEAACRRHPIVVIHDQKAMSGVHRINEGTKAETVTRVEPTELSFTSRCRRAKSDRHGVVNLEEKVNRK